MAFFWVQTLVVSISWRGPASIDTSLLRYSKDDQVSCVKVAVKMPTELIRKMHESKRAGILCGNGWAFCSTA